MTGPTVPMTDTVWVLMIMHVDFRLIPDHLYVNEETYRQVKHNY